MERLKMLRTFLTTSLWLAVLLPPASAQQFPSRTITLIVGSAPGGVADIGARTYAAVVSRNIGQPVIVEMRPAGAGVNAAIAVQNAKPDGYTLLIFPGSQMATVPAMQSVPYDPLTAFAPITYLFDNVSILTVPASSPVQTAAGLLEYAKVKPGGLLFGSQSFGVPPHLLAVRIAAAAKIPVVFVQYRGASPMMADLLAGRVDFALPSLTAATGFYAEKKLRALAVDAERRLPQLPDVPTLKEIGINESVLRWFGVAAPAGTSPEVIDRLHTEFVKASKDPEVIHLLESNGVLINTGTPEEMAKSMREEQMAMKQMINDLGLKQQ